MYGTLVMETEFVQTIANIAAPFMTNARLIEHLSTELERGKRIEQRLTLSEAGAQAILDALPDTVYRLDARGQILDVRAPGADASWMIDRHLRDVYPETVVALIEQALARVQSLGKMRHLEYSLPYPTGERTVEARLAPIWSEGAVLIERDITDAKRAERDLNQSRAQYRDLVNNVSGIVWEAELYSADYAQFTFISPQSQSIVGYPSEALLGSTRKWLEVIHPADRKFVVNELSRCRGHEVRHLTFNPILFKSNRRFIPNTRVQALTVIKHFNPLEHYTFRHGSRSNHFIQT